MVWAAPMLDAAERAFLSAEAIHFGTDESDFGRNRKTRLAPPCYEQAGAGRDESWMRLAPSDDREEYSMRSRFLGVVLATTLTSVTAGEAFAGPGVFSCVLT